MVIDFSRLNNSPSVTGGVRGNSATGSAEKPAASQEAVKDTGASGEAVHLSQEAQQLQKISDKLRDEPVVNSARVAQFGHHQVGRPRHRPDRRHEHGRGLGSRLPEEAVILASHSQVPLPESTH
jgi:negative regulator of flagellin synthesis FlgM